MKIAVVETVHRSPGDLPGRYIILTIGPVWTANISAGALPRGLSVVEYVENGRVRGLGKRLVAGSRE